MCRFGNHSINHNKLTKLSYSESLAELKSLNEAMKEKFNYNVKYFRPPYGRINFKTNKLMKETGMKCVMWSLLTYDYKKELKKVKFSINKYLRNNSIIVLHDNIKTKEIITNSVEYIVKKVDQNGFEFGACLGFGISNLPHSRFMESVPVVRKMERV